jgi:hypothetical protein
VRLFDLGQNLESFIAHVCPLIRARCAAETGQSHTVGNNATICFITECRTAQVRNPVPKKDRPQRPAKFPWELGVTC